MVVYLCFDMLHEKSLMGVFSSYEGALEWLKNETSLTAGERASAVVESWLVN